MKPLSSRPADANCDDENASALPKVPFQRLLAVINDKVAAELTAIEQRWLVVEVIYFRHAAECADFVKATNS